MDKLEAYVRQNDFDYPTLILDIDKVEENYHKLKAGLGQSHIHYAVKANPQKELIERLVSLGCRFDAASKAEIDICLDAGAKPAHISFGNTVKRVPDIRHAYAKGIRLFAADAEEELLKIAEHAPRSQVYIRVLVENSLAEWPLSRKFGCQSNHAVALIEFAHTLGLKPVGVSFHVGSQARHPHMWIDTLDMISGIWKAAYACGHELTLLNIGGGFPCFYGDDVTEAEVYGATLIQEIQHRFGNIPYIMAEPGRGMVGNAGMIVANVLLVAKKHPAQRVRWVYLDIGKFSGLAETDEEAIKYQFIFPDHDDCPLDDCILAGPTCDSADILYEKNRVKLPIDLRSGDKFIIKSCGAYTTTYSTVAFNGFPPLGVIVI